MGQRRGTLLLTCIAMFIAPAAGRAAVPPPVGQWAFDAQRTDGVTDSTADGSGNGLALAAPAGQMQLAPGDGRWGGAVRPANTTPLQVTSPVLAPPRVTLLAWVRQNGDPGRLRYLAGRGDDGGACGGSTFALYTGYSGGPGGPGINFYVRVASAGTPSFLTRPAPAATVYDGTWHLVAGTFDGSAVAIYLDGTLIDSQPVSSPLQYNLGGGGSLYIDGYPVEACPSTSNADDFPGSIDEVRVYDRALSGSELTELVTWSGPNAPDFPGMPSRRPSPPRRPRRPRIPRRHRPRHRSPLRPRPRPSSPPSRSRRALCPGPRRSAPSTPSRWPEARRPSTQRRPRPMHRRIGSGPWCGRLQRAAWPIRSSTRGRRASSRARVT